MSGGWRTVLSPALEVATLMYLYFMLHRFSSPKVFLHANYSLGSLTVILRIVTEPPLSPQKHNFQYTATWSYILFPRDLYPFTCRSARSLLPNEENFCPCTLYYTRELLNSNSWIACKKALQSQMFGTASACFVQYWEQGTDLTFIGSQPHPMKIKSIFLLVMED